MLYIRNDAGLDYGNTVRRQFGAGASCRYEVLTVVVIESSIF
jgi:hypothetical protein